MIKLSIFTFFFISSFVLEVNADIVYLKNGRSIEGVIKKEDEDRIELDVGFGTVTFRKEEIEDVERSSPEEVTRIRQEWQRQRKLEEERSLRREKELEKSRRKKELEPKEVRFTQDSEHIIVNALLNNKVNASLLLDTGASVVLLSERIAEELGIKARKLKDGQMVKVQMADGRKVDARFIVLDNISVEGVEAKDIGAVVLSDDTGIDIYDGLLGMSFLNRFNFQIDTVNKKLILERKD